MIQRVKAYLKKEIWRTNLEGESRPKVVLIQAMRIILLTLQGFSKKQVQLGASSLTYYSLLAIVPIIALLVGLARGFLLKQDLINWLYKRFGEQKIFVMRVIQFAEASLEQLRGSIMAALGMLLLLWAAIKILKNIEFVLNGMWKVKQHRSLGRQFSDYLALIFICPIFVFLASGLTVYITARLSVWEGEISLFKVIGPLVFFLFNIVPYLLTWLLFTFLYIFIPNTRVKLSSAIYAGIIAGTIYQLVQWVYVSFQINVASYNAIYGTFAAIPLFLIWVHLSWVIVLLGAKIAFAFQNVNAFEFVSENFCLSHQIKTLLCLRIAHKCVLYFCEGRPPLSHVALSNHLSIPLILTNELTYLLVQSGVLAEIKHTENGDTAFVPARDVNSLTIKNVIDMIDGHGEKIDLPPSAELTSIVKHLEAFSAMLEKSNNNILLREIHEQSA